MLDIDNSATTTFPSAQRPERAAKIQKLLEADFCFFFSGGRERTNIIFPKSFLQMNVKAAKWYVNVCFRILRFNATFYINF